MMIIMDKKVPWKKRKEDCHKTFIIQIVVTIIKHLQLNHISVLNNSWGVIVK